MDTDALVTRIKSEFNESPGMCLTLRQGARLWGIAPEECAKVVDRLVAEDFLRFRAEGWADVLSSAGAEPGEIAVTIDPHQKKAHLKKAQRIVITADI